MGNRLPAVAKGICGLSKIAAPPLAAMSGLIGVAVVVMVWLISVDPFSSQISRLFAAHRQVQVTSVLSTMQFTGLAALGTCFLGYSKRKIERLLIGIAMCCQLVLFLVELASIVIAASMM